MYLDSLTNAPPSPREQAQSPAPANSPAPAKKATLDNASREELVVFVKKQAAKMKGRAASGLKSEEMKSVDEGKAAKTKTKGRPKKHKRDKATSGGDDDSNSKRGKITR